MTPPGARLDLREDGLSVSWDGAASWRHLTVRCRLADGREHRAGGWAALGADVAAFAAACGPIQVRLRAEVAQPSLLLTAEVVASTHVEVAEVAISGHLSLNGSTPRWCLYNGYQSWDRSGCAEASSARDSWWTVGLADADGAGLAAVATGSSHSATKFTAEGPELSLTWCEGPGQVPLPLFSGAEGTRWSSPRVRLAVGGDVRGCLASLASVRRPSAAPVGWLSWYHFGPFVGRDEVLEHSQLLATSPFQGLGYRLLQVDDGWQQTYGEWEPNTKFPGGLAALAADLRARDQCLGAWTAPFLVSLSADLADQAPADWFVHEPGTGQRLMDVRHQVFGPMFVLDASRPAVQAHLRQLFAGLYRAGVRYFKIDFLYAGAYAGSRALAAGLAAIREGVRDAYVLACGAPLLPVAGVVDGCRIGPDTATPVPDPETGGPKPTIFAEEIVDVGRNLAARYFLDGWFQLDADVALVGGNLTVDQARQLVTLAALAGGPFLASDDLPRLPPERLALLTNREVLELVGGRPAVPDWEPNVDDLPPVHWRRGDVLALFNWTADEREVAVRAPGAVGARDLWERADVPGFADGTTIRVPANGVRLLRLDTR